MNIALLGYGKMGKEIEKIALERNHQVVLKIDIDNQADCSIENLKSADVAIDFSTPFSAYDNIVKCFNAGIPVVCGTTGWLERMDDIKDMCKRENQTFFYASNYSIGVNVFFAVNRYLASFMNTLPEYSAEMKEIHHIHKLDAPSGTAISLANDMLSKVDRLKSWKLNAIHDKSELKITAERRDEVPGTHIINWDSSVDQIEIRHEAKSRKGFALGAVLAAEYIRNRKGIFSMEDMLGIASNKF